MKKLNNKGMTTAEILVSFILVSIISATIYTTVSNYNTKRQVESYKLEINTYKNLLTKEIQDDLIKNGLINVEKKEFKEGNADIYIINLELKDHTYKRLVVKRQLANDYFITDEFGNITEDIKDYDDEFHLYYGIPYDINISTTNYTNGLIEYPIPELGYGYNHSDIDGSQPHIVKDLRLTNIIINTDNSTLSIFLGFHHVDLSTKYAINIVCPINYTS